MKYERMEGVVVSKIPTQAGGWEYTVKFDENSQPLRISTLLTDPSEIIEVNDRVVVEGTRVEVGSNIEVRATHMDLID